MYPYPTLSGADYALEFYAAAEEGCFFDDEVEIYINGERLANPMYSDVYDYQNTDSNTSVSVVCFIVEKTAGGTQSFFASLLNAITVFFARIASFFRGMFN